jgi:hypothetical protein
MHHLPCASRRRSRRPGRDLHQLPCEGGDVRHGRARGRRGLRDVPQAPRLRGPRREGVVPGLPRARGGARRRESGSCRLRGVSWRVGGAQDRRAGGVRHLPCRRAEVRTRRSPAMRGMSRAARRGAHPYLRHVPRKGDRRPACDDPGRLRDVPSSPRTGWDRRAARVRDLPCAGHAARASHGARSRRVRELSCVASRAAARRSRNLHGELPHGQARSPASRTGLRRVPRVPAMNARSQSRHAPPSARGVP